MTRHHLTRVADLVGSMRQPKQDHA